MKRHKNILILGLGGVGYYLAKRLSHEGHAITVVEQDTDLIRRADGEIDARLIKGNALSFDSWLEIETRKMDYLIAVTDHDAVNIVGSMIGDRCGIKQKIARVRSLELWRPDSIMTASDVNIDLVIRPEELTAREIARLIKIRAGNVVIDIAGGAMQVVATHISEDSPIAGMSLQDLSQQHDDFYFRVVSIARGVQTIIPAGNEELRPRDKAFILARKEDLPRVMELASVSVRRRHGVLIVGGGLVGSRVAELLERRFPVRLIEQNPARAEELSHRLKKTEILHGDASEGETLLYAGLLDMDTIIAATGDNETNIMTCVLAKSLLRSYVSEERANRTKTISLVDREQYLVLASTMGSDVVLSKKVSAANKILTYIRRGELLSVAHLHGFEAEVVEMVVGAKAPATRSPLYQIDGLKGRIIIGGFARKNVWQTAVGSTHLEPGDKVIAICTSGDLRDLQRLVLG